MASRGPYASWIRARQFKIARRLLPRVRRRIGSRTLREFLQMYERAQDGKAVLGVPHYWAVYYHDGTGAFGPSNATYLVYFTNALTDDPRLGGKYPIRLEEWRPLTKEEFQIGLEINRAFGFAFSGPFMIVSRWQSAREGDPFFEDTNPSQDASRIIPKDFSELVKKTLGKNFRRKETARGTIKVGL